MRLRWLLPALAGLIALPGVGWAASSRHRTEPHLEVQTTQGWQTQIEAESADLNTLKDIKASLGPEDPAAALEAVQRALEDVGDGQAYIWHRDVGPLWGVVHPLTSFRSASGSPCRRLSLSLSVGEYTRSTKLVACRSHAGRWEIAR
jgi:surface antigen